MKRRVVFLALLAAGLAGGIGFLSYGGAKPGPEKLTGQKAEAGPGISPQGKELLGQFSKAFEDAAAKVNPSVVPIFSEQITRVSGPGGSADDPFRQFFGDDFFKRFFGNPGPGGQKQTIHSLGSGVIVSPDGYILTNNHVVDGAEKLTVVLQDKKKYTAKVVGRDPQSDVAVVKIDAKELTAATLGNSDEVRVGQWVIAIGNPFQLMHTVTAGIISAKGRSSVNLADYEDFIQTDASINPGNSGGALSDLDGNVIGINTAIYSPSGEGGNVGIGFAIPINMAKSVMSKLIAHGKVSRGYLGVLPQDIDDNLAKGLDLKTSQGALVGDVTPDSPADKAGVKRGDIITMFNGASFENSVQLRNMVAAAEPGSEATLTLLRDGKAMKLSVKLGERPKDLASSSKESGRSEENTSTKLGLTVESLTGNIARELGYENEKGVVVTTVVVGSSAEEAGLRRGDLIKEVNRTAVASPRQFNQLVDHATNGGSLAMLVRRGDSTFYVALQAS